MSSLWKLLGVVVNFGVSKRQRDLITFQQDNAQSKTTIALRLTEQPLPYWAYNTLDQLPVALPYQLILVSLQQFVFYVLNMLHQINDKMYTKNKLFLFTLKKKRPSNSTRSVSTILKIGAFISQHYSIADWVALSVCIRVFDLYFSIKMVHWRKKLYLRYGVTSDLNTWF